MAVREYSVAEAAVKLGVTQMTVRRWAASGKLKARRLGKKWLLDRVSVDAVAGPSPALKRSLEVRRAVAQVLARRRLRDWLPDAVAYDDVFRNRAALVRSVERRWNDGDLEGRQLEHIPIPKDRLSFRPGALLRLEDEVLLNAVVLSMGPHIEAALGDEVYSYRMAPGSARHLLVDQPKAYGRFQELQRNGPSDGWTYVLKTDVAGFYEYIDADVLADTLTDLGAEPEDTGAVKALMKGWHKKSGLRGLPQGPDASAVLSNAYMVPIDEEMNSLCRTNGWQYARWSDDIRVFTHAYDDARTAAFRLSLAARRQGLYLQGSKTRVESAQRVADDATAADLGVAAYFFSLGAMGRVKKLIGPIFRRATHGGKRIDPEDLTELRFSLYRLGALADDRALKLLLKVLPVVGFLGDFIYLYLRAFLNRASVVARMVDVLDNLDPERDAYLAGQLLRTLQEAPSLPPSALDVLRRYATSYRASPAVRAVATTALGRHGLPFDETQIRTALWKESDPRTIRAQLAALVRLAPKRSRATLGDYKRANPPYGGTVDYLLGK